MAVQESHQLLAFVDIYESLQIYNLMTGAKMLMLSSKPVDDEVLSRSKDDSEDKRQVYYNLHFIENSNKV